MQLESYEEDDGFRVSLTKEEREALYDEIDNTTSSIAWGLASYCGYDGKRDRRRSVQRPTPER